MRLPCLTTEEGDFPYTVSSIKKKKKIKKTAKVDPLTGSITFSDTTLVVAGTVTGIDSSETTSARTVEIFQMSTSSAGTSIGSLNTGLTGENGTYSIGIEEDVFNVNNGIGLMA